MHHADILSFLEGYTAALQPADSMCSGTPQALMGRDALSCR